MIYHPKLSIYLVVALLAIGHCAIIYGEVVAEKVLPSVSGKFKKKPTNSGSGTWDWDNQVSLSCSKGWVFNDKKVCVPVSDQCASSDEKGNCLTYDLKDNK